MTSVLQCILTFLNVISIDSIAENIDSENISVQFAMKVKIVLPFQNSQVVN